MAFGGLGGLGGRPAFPMRFGAPSSQHVQSLDELQKPIWDEYNAMVAARGQEADNFWSQNQGVLDARTAGVPNLTPQHRAQIDRTLKQAGSHLGGEWMFAHDPNAASIGAQYDQVMAPVDPTPFQQRADALAAPFLERQTRNQQAYDTMLRPGEMNGMMPPNYSDANFGSVSGQQNTGVSQQPGVGMDWASGVYDPQFASGMFGNSGASRNAGRWL